MKNNQSVTKWKVVLLSWMMLSSTTFAANYDLCVSQGYTFGFFNGVWNTYDQADDSLDEMEVLRSTTFNQQPIQYEVFYNHTGPSVGASGMQDLAEVFIQRAKEIDDSGQLGMRFEYFWDNLVGDKTLTEKLKGLIPKSAALLDGIYTALTTKLVGWISSWVSDPPTEKNHTEHNTRLDALAIQGQKMILVAHSQGNLFVNQAYDHISPVIGEASVGVVHIAPASPTLRGEHLLADIDLVINGLRVTGINSVPPININLPFAKADPSRHTLVGTYLDSTRAARAKILSMMDVAMTSLVSPTIKGNVGSFTVTLTWDGTGDVDLHTLEPNSKDVYFRSRQGQSGYLDVDNTVADGPEHYYATCDSSLLQAGVYKVGIENYSGAKERTAVVQLATSTGGVIENRKLTVEDVSYTEDFVHRITPVFDVNVTKDANGMLKINGLNF